MLEYFNLIVSFSLSHTDLGYFDSQESAPSIIKNVARGKVITLFFIIFKNFYLWFVDLSLPHCLKLSPFSLRFSEKSKSRLQNSGAMVKSRSGKVMILILKNDWLLLFMDIIDGYCSTCVSFSQISKLNSAMLNQKTESNGKALTRKGNYSNCIPLKLMIGISMFRTVTSSIFSLSVSLRSTPKIKTGFRPSLNVKPPYWFESKRKCKFICFFTQKYNVLDIFDV